MGLAMKKSIFDASNFTGFTVFTLMDNRLRENVLNITSFTSLEMTNCTDISELNVKRVTLGRVTESEVGKATFTRLTLLNFFNSVFDDLTCTSITEVTGSGVNVSGSANGHCSMFAQPLP